MPSNLIKLVKVNEQDKVVYLKVVQNILTVRFYRKNLVLNLLLEFLNKFYHKHLDRKDWHQINSRNYMNA